MHNRPIFVSLMTIVVGLVLAPALLAHCQIPCGIYGDPARFDAMKEHVRTIEKSMLQIDELGKAETPNWNQLVRWVGNKEDHANQLMDVITSYFMAQRIKSPAHGDEAAEAKYVTEITLLHKMIVHSMKAKQTTDVANVAALNKLIDAFEHSYLGENHG